MGWGEDRWKPTICRMAQGKKGLACYLTCREAKGQIGPCFFETFFRMTNLLRKAYFLREKLGSLERKLPRLGIGNFWNFLALTTFWSINSLKKARSFSSLAKLIRVK
jgi:hypothetical protein